MPKHFQKNKLEKKKKKKSLPQDWLTLIVLKCYTGKTKSFD